MSLRDAFDKLSAAFPGMVCGEWEGSGPNDMVLDAIVITDGKYRILIDSYNVAEVAPQLLA